jgi:hypothetical protein
MQYPSNIRSAAVAKLSSDPLVRSNLPPTNTTRWTARRKAEIVEAVEKRLLSSEQVHAWYGISSEELHEWQDASDRAGLSGLRITRSQQYRRQSVAEIAAAAY